MFQNLHTWSHVLEYKLFTYYISTSITGKEKKKHDLKQEQAHIVK